jgi:two-component system sensor histidine kinase AlgZ
MRSLLSAPARTLRPLRSAIVFVFGPIAHEMWIYVVFPLIFLLGSISSEPGMNVGHHAAELGLAFTILVCLGMPMHLWYGHFAERLLPRAFAWRELPIHAAVLTGGSLIGTELGLAILVPVFVPLLAPGHLVTLEEVSGWRRAGWAMGMLGGGLTASVFLSMWRYRNRIEDVEEREVEAQAAATHAHLQALQARVQPHFLFNCLNTVAGLIEEDPKRAETAIERLSDLFRYTLDSSRVSSLPLAQELAIVRDYLALETLRYGDRLKAAIHVEPGSEAVLVPPLVLQPAVENAVLHGVAPRREGGRIEVGVRVLEQDVVLSVEDDGPGAGASGHVGSGTALADLRHRLDLLYGDRARVEQDEGPLGGFRLRITLPLEPVGDPT